MTIHKVCVLFGGVSTEHLISCISAANIIEGLQEIGYEVYPVGMTPEGEFLRYLGSTAQLRSGEWVEVARALLAKAAARPVTPADLASPKHFLSYHCAGEVPDVIFPAVHGINCEDGVLQGFLEMCQIPYVGAGVLSSAAGMDKVFAKMVFEAAGIPVVPYAIAYRQDIVADVEALSQQLLQKLGLPLFLKPANGGSSVGTKAVLEAAALAEALEEVSSYDEKVLVESFVDAREIEVAVLGNRKPRAAVPGEIVKEEAIAYYDYETKYFKQGADVALPAAIPDEMAERMTEMALKAYLALACEGLARVDFFLDKHSGAIYLNEINTLPGFTPISLYPKAWEKSGLNRKDLLRILCELAVERRERNVRQTTAFRE